MISFLHYRGVVSAIACKTATIKYLSIHQSSGALGGFSPSSPPSSSPPPSSPPSSTLEITEEELEDKDPELRKALHDALQVRQAMKEETGYSLHLPLSNDITGPPPAVVGVSTNKKQKMTRTTSLTSSPIADVTSLFPGAVDVELTPLDRDACAIIKENFPSSSSSPHGRDIDGHYKTQHMMEVQEEEEFQKQLQTKGADGSTWIAS